MNGIIIINKPKNYTSFDIIAILRKKLEQKKIGHMGTLDPMAVGVLPILLGETAKFQVFTKNHYKKYIASMQLGITTDTLDTTGKILSKNKSNIKFEIIEKILPKFMDEIIQIPPMFSAVKQNGKKLYELARKGIEVDRNKRKVFIENLKLIEFNELSQTAILEISCSKGTYIRTLCADIGEKLGCGAVMSELTRISSNGFDISQSVTLDFIQNASLDTIINNYILPTESLFENLDKINITKLQEKRIKNGGNLDIARLNLPEKPNDSQMYKIYSEEKFIGIGNISCETNELKILKCLHTE